MKDYLEENGIIITPVTPRNVIKEAFAAGMIDNGQVWIDMMLHRNLLAHTYDFSKFKEVLETIENHYLAALNTPHEWFVSRQLESSILMKVAAMCEVGRVVSSCSGPKLNNNLWFQGQRNFSDKVLIPFIGVKHIKQYSQRFL